MLTTETASAVVHGKGSQDMAEKVVQCHATSSFLIEGEHVENGSNLEVPESLYKDLRAAQRVEPGHVAPATPAPEPKGKGKGSSE